MGDGIPWINRLPGYHYYDTPDGEDCLKKLVFMNKMALFFGLSAGTLDVLGMSKARGFVNIAGRYGVVTFPIMAVASTFGAVTCMSTNIRDKDDMLNYTIGGFTAGCVAGACAKSGTFGTLCAVAFAALGATQKYIMDNDLPVTEKEKDMKLAWGGIWSIKYDFSLTPERPRGWKTSEN